MKISTKEKEIRAYVMNYLEQLEYKKMRKDLDKILESTTNLTNSSFPNQKMNQLMFILNLIPNGYFSVNNIYSYNAAVPKIGYYQDSMFELALPVFTGEGCCRHSAALLKLILDELKIENEIVAVDTLRKDKNLAEIRMFLSEYHKKVIGGNHLTNYVSIDNCDFFVDVAYEFEDSVFSYNDNGFINYFHNKDNEENCPFLFNYSPLYEGRKDIRKIEPLTIEKQQYIKESYDQVSSDLEDKLLDIILMKKENEPYVEDIKTNYQKVLIKERKLGLR